MVDYRAAIIDLQNGETKIYLWSRYEVKWVNAHITHIIFQPQINLIKGRKNAIQECKTNH